MSRVAVVMDNPAYVPEELCKKTNISVVASQSSGMGKPFLRRHDQAHQILYAPEECKNHADYLPGNPSGYAQDIFRSA